MRLPLFLLLLAPLAAVAAGKPEVYKWVDKNGVVHYTDKPPSDGAPPAKLPPLQTYKGGTPPPIEQFVARPEAPRKAAPGGDVQLELLAPVNEETFRSGERTIPVAVTVTPALDPSHRLVYLLDGAPRSEPTTETSYALTEVDRGTHQVSVMLTSEDGAEISRSSAVTVHMKPPVASSTKTVPTPTPNPSP